MTDMTVIAGELPEKSTFRRKAERQFDQAVAYGWISGEGRYAVVSWCGPCRVMLHRTRAEAAAGKRTIDQFGCGGSTGCGCNHDLRVLK
jgi:hypothetical protein